MAAAKGSRPRRSSNYFFLRAVLASLALTRFLNSPPSLSTSCFTCSRRAGQTMRLCDSLELPASMDCSSVESLPACPPPPP